MHAHIGSSFDSPMKEDHSSSYVLSSHDSDLSSSDIMDIVISVNRKYDHSNSYVLSSHDSDRLLLIFWMMLFQ